MAGEAVCTVQYLHGSDRVIWMDGDPPLFVACAKGRRPNVRKLYLDHSQRWKDFAGHRTLHVTVFVGPLGQIVPMLDAIRLIFARGADEVCLRFAGPVGPTAWSKISAWIDHLRSYLARTGSKLELQFVMEVVLDAVDFDASQLEQIAGRGATIEFTDSTIASGHNEPMIDRAAALADSGLIVRPTLCLTRSGMKHWERLTESYRVATHGAGVSLVCPPFFPSPPSTWHDAPEPQAFATFLSSIYEGARHDLTVAHPFSSVLTVLAQGSSFVPICGSPKSAAIDWNGRLFRCPERCVSAPAGGDNAHCKWGPLCTALSGTCLRNARLAGFERIHLARFCCQVAQQILPLIFRDLWTNAQSQLTLSSRAPDDRFRIAVKDGLPIVWTERIIADHRDRFTESNNDHGNPHDLSWIRSRVASDSAAGNESAASA